ncbi:hypothetical protein OTB20_40150 [Streptomyces sp. H27-H1]|uniref:hypothetical protein n=1 Tax=Streptomyces sp. H27-H1 TaxID=2996461 RepID=UPI0022720840|nr:hypothetical protein [Streptomyces sp. H27-H1]MCY0932265.1 hypothetical protein [Streptomyces sp. H27-H1]
MHDNSPKAPRSPAHAGPRSKKGGAGGFGWPVGHHLARATAVTRRLTGGKTVSALLDR